MENIEKNKTEGRGVFYKIKDLWWDYMQNIVKKT